MFHEKLTAKCRTIMKITDRGTFYCNKPAHIVIVGFQEYDPIILCPDCARELTKQLIDSVPGGRRDASRRGH